MSKRHCGIIGNETADQSQEQAHQRTSMVLKLSYIQIFSRKMLKILISHRITGQWVMRQGINYSNQTIKDPYKKRTEGMLDLNRNEHLV